MAADKNKSEVVLAFLALDDAKRTSVGDFRKSLIKVFGSDKDIEDLQDGDNSLSFKYKGNFYVLGYIPKPIPWSDLEGPCRTAWWWKNAEKEMKDHKAHIIATVMGDEGSRLDRTVALTKYIAAAADCHNSAGIYWGDGTVVHRKSKGSVLEIKY